MTFSIALVVILEADNAIVAEAVATAVTERVSMPVERRYPVEKYPKFESAWKATVEFHGEAEASPSTSVTAVLQDLGSEDWWQVDNGYQAEAVWKRDLTVGRVFVDRRVRWAHVEAWLFGPDPDAEPDEFEELEPDPPASEGEAGARLDLARLLAEYAESQERAEAEDTPRSAIRRLDVDPRPPV